MKTALPRRLVLCTSLVVLTLLALVSHVQYLQQTRSALEISNDATTTTNVLLVTYVFGPEAANKRYLRIFIESARRSGVDLAVVGHPAPAFALPPNVRHFAMTWDELVDRVKYRILQGKEPSLLRAAAASSHNYYKVIDLKPMIAFLLPELVQGYDWWGHVDNDMILGNLGRFFTSELLDRHDIICGIATEKTWGPLTLYRNIPRVNELFWQSPQPLHTILNTTQPMYFDEWSHRGTGHPSKPGTRRYQASMSGIVAQHAPRLGLSWYGGIPFEWDGDCRQNKQQQCGECVLTRQGNHLQRLVATNRKCRGTICDQEVGLCHYIHAKQTSLESSLADDRLMDRMIVEGQFRVSHKDGFSVLGEIAPRIIRDEKN